jgi:hypothetical protein
MTVTIDRCCFCDRADIIKTNSLFGNAVCFAIECPSCGDYAANALDARYTISAREDRGRIAMRIRSRKLRGQLPVIVSSKLESSPIPGWVVQSVEDLAPSEPLRVSLRLDEALLNLGSMASRPGQSLALMKEAATAVALWADDTEGAGYVFRALVELGRIEDFKNTGAGPFQIRLTPKGWEHFEHLREGMIGSGPPTAFVAMYFHEELFPVFSEVIRPALAQVGYEAERVDQREHNHRIDDEIIARIRASRFVLADFTGHRGGVYYEAGFAHGLGKPVIFTVRGEEDLKKAHFDTNHFKHIVWEPGDLEAFYKALVNRVLATIGPGQATK